MIILYTIGCPQCNVLKTKLDKKNISYTTVTDKNKMREMGLSRLPVLEVDGNIMEFPAANTWINNQ